jgi:hypothetical protein
MYPAGSGPRAPRIRGEESTKAGAGVSLTRSALRVARHDACSSAPWTFVRREEQDMIREANPNQSRTIALIVVLVGALLAMGVAVAKLVDRSEFATREPASVASAERVVRQPQQVAAATPSGPPASVIAKCNELAAQARRDNTRILRDGVVGGAVGAGVGAAGGAIADGGEGAGKGAGIGALVGAAAGALYGLNEENRRSEQATAAYQQCMASRGY